MGFRKGLNEWSSIILKWMAICCIVIAGLWIILSIWGNIDNGKIDPPDNKKANYAILLTATGQTIYTDDYNLISEGKYKLSGYFELVKNKWIYRDEILSLDEYYFGDIIIRRR